MTTIANMLKVQSLHINHRLVVFLTYTQPILSGTVKPSEIITHADYSRYTTLCW